MAVDLMGFPPLAASRAADAACAAHVAPTLRAPEDSRAARLQVTNAPQAGRRAALLHAARAAGRGVRAARQLVTAVRVDDSGDPAAERMVEAVASCFHPCRDLPGVGLSAGTVLRTPRGRRVDRAVLALRGAAVRVQRVLVLRRHGRDFVAGRAVVVEQRRERRALPRTAGDPRSRCRVGPARLVGDSRSAAAAQHPKRSRPAPSREGVRESPRAAAWPRPVAPRVLPGAAAPAVRSARGSRRPASRRAVRAPAGSAAADRGAHAGRDHGRIGHGRCPPSRSGHSCSGSD